MATKKGRQVLARYAGSYERPFASVGLLLVKAGVFSRDDIGLACAGTTNDGSLCLIHLNNRRYRECSPQGAGSAERSGAIWLSGAPCFAARLSNSLQARVGRAPLRAASRHWHIRRKNVSRGTAPISSPPP